MNIEKAKELINKHCDKITKERTASLEACFKLNKFIIKDIVKLSGYSIPSTYNHINLFVKFGIIKQLPKSYYQIESDDIGIVFSLDQLQILSFLVDNHMSESQSSKTSDSFNNLKSIIDKNLYNE